MHFDKVGQLDRCLPVLARHWLWRGYSSFVGWITQETRQGWLRIPVCHTPPYRLALPYYHIRVASVVATACTELTSNITQTQVHVVSMANSVQTEFYE